MRSALIVSIAALGGVLASPMAVVDLLRRQLPCADIAEYFKLVNTALFAVNYVDSFSHPCDTALVPYFDSQGLNGRYAVDIICLYDAGVVLFDESLEVVNDILIVTLIGLFDSFVSATDPSRNLSCANINSNILEELELDSAVIRNIICDYTPCGAVPPTTNTTSSSSATSRSSSCCATGSPSTVAPSGSVSSAAPTSSLSASSSKPLGTSVSSTGLNSSPASCTRPPPATGSSITTRQSPSNLASGSSSGPGSTGGATGSLTSSLGTSSSMMTSIPSTSNTPDYPPPQSYY